jgi:hypothetical protein
MVVNELMGHQVTSRNRTLAEYQDADAAGSSRDLDNGGKEEGRSSVWDLGELADDLPKGKTFHLAVATLSDEAKITIL